MSRGLGKVQRAVLECLKFREGWTQLTTLTIFAYHPERYEWEGSYWFDDGPGDYSHTRSEYVATYRAIKRLEELGLVETRQRKVSLADFGGATRWTEVKIKC